MSKVDSTEIGKIYSFINLVKIKVGGFGIFQLIELKVQQQKQITAKETQLIKCPIKGIISKMVFNFMLWKYTI